MQTSNNNMIDLTHSPPLTSQVTLCHYLLTCVSQMCKVETNKVIPHPPVKHTFMSVKKSLENNKKSGSGGGGGYTIKNTQQNNLKTKE
jgi:hypothetical protein